MIRVQKQVRDKGGLETFLEQSPAEGGFLCTSRKTESHLPQSAIWMFLQIFDVLLKFHAGICFFYEFVNVVNLAQRV